MKKVAIAVVAAFMSMAFAGAYAGEEMKKADKMDKSKGEMMKSDTAKDKMDMKADKSKKKEEPKTK